MKGHTGDTRRKNRVWSVCEPDTGNRIAIDGAQLAVLQDIRDELQKLNQLLHCPNCIAIPAILREIRQNTRKRKPAKAGAR